MLRHDQKASLLKEISRLMLLVKALWLNRPLAPNSTDEVGVNLVLIPLKTVRDAQEASLRFEWLEGMVWIKW
jgi:hypothetical protein